MVMDMRAIRMRANDESIVAFEKSAGQFITDLVRFFRRDLARFKRLPNLIGNHIVLLRSSGEDLILALGQQKLTLNRARITFIRRDELLLVRLVRIHGIGRAVMQTLCQRFSLIQMH